MGLTHVVAQKATRGIARCFILLVQSIVVQQRTNTSQLTSAERKTLQKLLLPTRCGISYSPAVFPYTAKVQCVSTRNTREPGNAYGQSKLMTENVPTQLGAEANMKVTILRLSTVYGEGEPGNVSRLIKGVAKCGPLVLGSGRNKKSMTYVDNVTALCSKLAECSGSGGLSIMNVADPEPYTLEEIVSTIALALNRSGRLIRVNSKLAPLGSWCLTSAARLFGRNSPLTPDQVIKIIEDAVCDVTKLRKEVGFVAPILLNEGIRRTVEWYKSKGTI